MTVNERGNVKITDMTFSEIEKLFTEQKTSIDMLTEQVADLETSLKFAESSKKITDLKNEVKKCSEQMGVFRLVADQLMNELVTAEQLLERHYIGVSPTIGVSIRQYQDVRDSF